MEETRAAWSWTLVEHLGKDLRYGARTLARNPAFTVLAVLSRALGIGANTAIYSFMNALLMRRLPVADTGSLVVLKWQFKALGGVEAGGVAAFRGQAGRSVGDGGGGGVCAGAAGVADRPDARAAVRVSREGEFPKGAMP